MTLKTVEKTRSTAWLRTSDGLFDVLGVDLNCTSRAARAAGAGPVWMWRTAKETSDWWCGDDVHPFADYRECLGDLEAVNYAVTTCGSCGQANRRPVRRVVRCGKCGGAL